MRSRLNIHHWNFTLVPTDFLIENLSRVELSVLIGPSLTIVQRGCHLAAVDLVAESFGLLLFSHDVLLQVFT